MLKMALKTITLNLEIYDIEHRIYPYYQEEFYVYHRDLSATKCTVYDRYGSRGQSPPAENGLDEI